MIELPTWIDREAWDAWLAARKHIKKPVTDRIATRAVNKLQKMREDGHDPNESLNQSADFYWQDLYPPKPQQAPKPATFETFKERDARLIAERAARFTSGGYGKGDVLDMDDAPNYRLGH